MTSKTYEIPGLMEWHGTLSAQSGSLKLKVSFLGGVATSFGVAPATFTTTDPLAQFIIEHSDRFKKGFIRLGRVTEVADDEATIKRKAAEAAAEKAAMAKTKKTAPKAEDNTDGNTEGDKDETDTEGDKDETDTEGDMGETDTEGDMGETDVEDDKAKTVIEGEVIEVASKADAVEWLKEHFSDKGYTATKLLRTNKAFKEACEECGVKFSIGM